MITAAALIWGLIFPALLVAAVMLFIGRHPNLQWLPGPLFCAAIAVAYAALHWPLAAPSTNAVHWIFWFTIPAAILTALDGLLKPPLWLRALILLILWRLAVRALLAPLVPDTLKPSDEEFWIDVSAAIVLLWWLTLETLSQRIAGTTVSWLLTILCFGIGLLIFTMLHCIQLGLLGISLAIISGASAVAIAWNKKSSLARGGAGAIVWFVMLLLVFDWFYTDDTLTTGQQIRAAVLLAAPLLAFVGDVPIIAKLHPTRRMIARLLAVGLAVAVVSAACIRDYAQAERAAAMQSEQ